MARSSRVTAQAETTHAHSSYAQETPSWAEQLKGQTVVEDAIEGHPERTAMVERQHHRIMQQMEKDAEAQHTDGFYHTLNMMHQYGAGNQDVLLMSNPGVEPVSALGGRCPATAPIREYDISAINVEITLNMWLDFYPGYMYVLTQNIEKVREEERKNREAREFVKARERFLALSHTPFEMKFTALDGREVDVAKLRGKVVLIDFWASWCNPCIAELPNVKAVYKEYRDKGFEIIGISVDSERDRRKFADLVAEKGVTWPQHFDGKGWDNQYALQYTVTGVPAMFLLDKKGLLVSTDARGEKLGAEVKRLLEQ